VSIADEAEHVMIVTDADGNILWREGQAGVLVRADRVMLSEGTRWSEDAMGTNAMGTALAVGAPVQVHSGEHLVRTYHRWTCSAAPVRDPDTGELIGCIDVTGPLYTRHPATLALVTAAAQLAEGQLRAKMAVRDEALMRRNLPHLTGPGALLSPTGRVLALESCALPSSGHQQRPARPGRRPVGAHRAAGRGLPGQAGRDGVADRARAAAVAGVPGRDQPGGRTERA
jgi:transcriptional regulator of acetoin/glycerol metabolism